MITKSVRSRLCIFPERPSKSHGIKRNHTLALLYTAPTVTDIHICRRHVSVLKHRIQVIQNRRRPTFLLFYPCIPIYICFVLTLYDMTRVTVCEDFKGYRGRLGLMYWPQGQSVCPTVQSAYREHSKNEFIILSLLTIRFNSQVQH